VQGVWKGTHGGPTWKVQHVPLIMAGPGIRQGVHSQFPARAIDIAPTMERLLGIPAIQRDGVLLADALTDAAAWEKRPQALAAPSLSADVNALALQSSWDTHAHRAHWPTVTRGIWRCSLGAAGTTTRGHACVIKPRAATNS
jgi:arylsulfatase A-like enzyme